MPWCGVALLAYILIHRHSRQCLHLAVERGMAHGHLVGEEDHVQILLVEMVVYQLVESVEEILVDRREYRSVGRGLQLALFHPGRGIAHCHQLSKLATAGEKVANAAVQQPGREGLGQVGVRPAICPRKVENSVYLSR